MSPVKGHFSVSPSLAQFSRPTPSPQPTCTDLHLPSQGQLQQLAKVLAQRAQGLTHAGLHRLQDVLIFDLEAPREKT